MSRGTQVRPSIADNLMCSHTHRPMHRNCAAPVSDPNQDRYCIEPMLEQPSGQNGHPGTPSDETVTVFSPVNILTLSSVTECTVNTVNSHTTHLYVHNPSQLYDTLYPLLSHQHFTLTSLQHILQPIQHLTTLPTHTLPLLHQLLGRYSSASTYLPPLPEGSRPRRAPPISYTDPHDSPTIPPPPLLSFPPWDPMTASA